MTLRLLATSTPTSLVINVNTVEQETVNFAPYPVYAEMTSDGAYPRASQFDFGELTNNTDPDIDQAMRSSMCYWSTGDTGQFRNTKVPDATFKDKTRLDGPYMAYVYDTPGEYTLRAHKFDPDGSYGQSAGKTITVVDPATYFPANRTLLVATDNDFTGAPHEDDPQVHTFTSLNAARNFMNTMDRSGGVRLCLKTGQTFSDLANPLQQNWSDGGVSLVDSFGGNSAPVVDLLGSNTYFLEPDSGLVSTSWRIKDVDFRGAWNAEASMKRGSGSGIAEWVLGLKYNAVAFDLVMDTVCNVRFFDCRGSIFRQEEGSGTLVEKNDINMGYLFLQDVAFENNGNYHVLGHHRAMGTFVIGCVGAPDPYACIGSVGRSALPENYALNSHNAFRNGWGIFGMWSSSMEERHAWSGVLEGDTQVSAQQTIRLSGKKRVRQIFSGSYLGTVASVLLGATDKRDYLGNILVDKCMFLQAPLRQSSVNYIANTLQPGVTMRNCLAIRSAVPSITEGNYPTRNFDRFTGSAGFNGDSTPFRLAITSSQPMPAPVDLNIQNADAAILNCAVIDLKAGSDGAMDGTSLQGGNASPGFTITEQNNFVYAPNLTTPINADLSLDTTALDFQSEMGAPRWVWEMARGTLGAALNHNATTAIAYPDDWYGNATQASDYAGAYSNPRHTIWFPDLYFLRYDNAAAAFTVGATLDIGNGRTIEAVTDQGNGEGVIVFSGGNAGVSNNATITDTSGGSALANGGTRFLRVSGYSGNNNVSDVLDQAMSLTFGASGITLENTSGFDWPSGYDYNLILDRGTTLMATDEAMRVADGTLSQYKPISSIASEAVFEKDMSLEDMGRNLRLGTNHPDAPFGMNSRGPWQV